MCVGRRWDSQIFLDESSSLEAFFPPMLLVAAVGRKIKKIPALSHAVTMGRNSSQQLRKSSLHLFLLIAKKSLSLVISFLWVKIPFHP